MAGGGGSDSFDAGEGTVPRQALCPHKETVGVLTGAQLNCARFTQKEAGSTTFVDSQVFGPRFFF